MKTGYKLFLHIILFIKNEIYHDRFIIIIISYFLFFLEKCIKNNYSKVPGLLK